MTLSAEEIEAIAVRTAELLKQPQSPLPELVDTAEVARSVKMSEDWVRAHAAELGGIRTGASKHTALRFDPLDVAAGMEARKLERPGERRRRRPGPAKTVPFEVLPLPRQDAA